MQFDSFQAFLDMGGYGFYVWLAFAVTFLAMIALVYESIWAKKQLIVKFGAQIARKKRIKDRQAKEALDK
jgi:heme exporter protein D